MMEACDGCPYNKGGSCNSECEQENEPMKRKITSLTLDPEILEWIDRMTTELLPGVELSRSRTVEYYLRLAKEGRA